MFQVGHGVLVGCVAGAPEPDLQHPPGILQLVLSRLINLVADLGEEPQISHLSVFFLLGIFSKAQHFGNAQALRGMGGGAHGIGARVDVQFIDAVRFDCRAAVRRQVAARGVGVGAVVEYCIVAVYGNAGSPQCRLCSGMESAGGRGAAQKDGGQRSVDDENGVDDDQVVLGRTEELAGGSVGRQGTGGAAG